MKFLKNTYEDYSLKWIVQRALIVIKERRVPRIGQLLNDLRLSKSSSKKNKTVREDEAVVYYPGTISIHDVEIPGSQKQSHFINSYFDCIYLLNLEHRADKRLTSVRQFQQLGIEAKIVDAVNGYQSPHKEEFERYYNMPLGTGYDHPLERKYRRKMIASPGAWGVLKSKKLIFLDAIKNDYKRILILQDDIFYIEDFHNRFESFINEIDHEWKIIALGATQHSWDVPTSLYYKDKNIREYDPGQKFYYPLLTDGAFALGYDHSIFQFIIDEIDKMNCSFDSGAVRMVYKTYKTRCFVCQPNLIIADVSTSDIRGGRNQEEFASKMKWDLRMYDRNKYDENP